MPCWNLYDFQDSPLDYFLKNSKSILLKYLSYFGCLNGVIEDDGLNFVYILSHLYFDKDSYSNTNHSLLFIYTIDLSNFEVKSSYFHKMLILLNLKILFLFVFLPFSNDHLILEVKELFVLFIHWHSFI